MAKYNLVVKYVDDVKYNILWNKMFMESDFNLNSLMHIDFFTSRFKDKRELMDFIEFFELVEKRDIRKRIKIEYKNAGVIKEEQLIYKDDLKFMNIEYLSKYMALKYQDVKFLQYLVDAFGDNPIQKKNIEIFKVYINKHIHGFYSEHNFPKELDLTNNIKALSDFIFRQIYKYDNDVKAYVYNEDGTPKLNYKQYRDLSKIVSNYSKKNDTKEEMQIFESTHFENQNLNNSLKSLIKRK